MCNRYTQYTNTTTEQKMPIQPKNPNRINACLSLDRETYDLFRMSDIGQVMTPAELIDAVLATAIGTETQQAMYYQAWLDAYNQVKEIVKSQIKDRMENKTDYIKKNLQNLPYYEPIFNFMVENSLKDNKLVTINRYNNRLQKIIEYELSLGKFQPNNDTNLLYEYICDEIRKQHPNLNHD